MSRPDPSSSSWTDVSEGSRSAPLRVAAIVAAEGISGPGRQLAAVAGALRPFSVELRVLILSRTGRSRPEFAALLEQHRVHCEVIEDHGPIDPFIIRRVGDILEAWSPDIVQTHGYKATAIAWALHRTRLRWAWVGFFHGSTSESWRARIYHRLDRRMLRAADRIVVMSRRQLGEFAAQGERVRLLHNAVVSLSQPPDAETDRTRLRQLLERTSRPRIGVIGRLSPEKGVDILLHALAELRSRGHELTVVVAGTGPERISLEALRDTLGLGAAVIFAGDVRVVDALYEALDLVVIPSRSEGLPNVLLEALAADVPVVATAVGAIPDVLGDSEAGRLVAPEDHIGLADAIASILDAGDSENARRARRMTAERFSLEQRASEHLELYREVLARRRRNTR